MDAIVSIASVTKGNIHHERREICGSDGDDDRKPEEYELKIEVPGVGKEDAELHMDGKTLTLKTHAKYQSPAGFKQVAAEFERSNYAISADLPEMADPKTLTAKLENGILTVTIKKRAESQPKQIEIQ